MLSLPGACVQFLVGELRSHMLHSMAKKKAERDALPLSGHSWFHQTC